MPVYKKVDQDFFKKWSSDMAYVLGFFAADGNLICTKRNTHFLSICSLDRDILKAILHSMSSEHALSKRSARSGSVYRFQIGSKVLYEDLTHLGFEQRKSNRMRVPSIPDQYFWDFVRGYFDGDGNVWIGNVNKKRKTSFQVLQLAFTSGSEGFLSTLQSELTLRGVKGGSLYTSKIRNFSRLQYSTTNALKMSEFMYNGQPKLHLKRKKLRFDIFRSNNCGGSSTG